MLKRFLAVLTTAVLALGLSLGATAPASANSETCNSIGYTKFDSASGSQTLPWGTLTWSGQSLTYTLGAGWTVDLCIKSGSQAGTSTYQDVSGTGTLTISQGISHIGYKDPTHANGLTCSAATLYKSTPLANGDHINMDVSRNGGAKFQVNAYIDIAQSPPQDPASESGLVVRLTLDGSPVTLPLTNAQKAAGVLAFDYSSGWTGSWTVEWVQYNSSYFNQDRDSAKFLNCQKDAPISVSTAPSAVPPTCDADGTLNIPTQANITFTGGTHGAGPGTYTINATAATGYVLTGPATWTITVLAKGTGVNCEKSVTPTITVAECNPATGAFVSGYITIPSTTPHLSYSIGATTYAAGQKVDLAAGSYTVDVTAESGWTNTGPASYSITIPALGCDKAVEPTLTVAQCDATTGAFVGAFITIPSTTPHLTYSIGAVNYTAGQKVDLAAGSYTVNVTAEAGWTNTGPSSFTINVAGLGCEKSVEPALTVAQCDATTGAFVGAFITIPSTTPHLTYSIGAVSYTAGQQVALSPGSYTVTVTAESGWKNTGPTSYPITIAALGCEKSVEPTLNVAQCDATTGAFVSGFITIPSTTPHLTYSIGAVNYTAGQKVTLSPGSYTVTVTAESGWTNTGPASYPITIAALGCEKSVEPTLTISECDATTGAVVSAFITIPSTTPHLTYSIGSTDYASGEKVTLSPGSYTVTVTAASGWTNTGPASYSITIAALGCDRAVEPTLTAGECTALTGPVSAFITIPTTTPHLIYSIDGTDYAAGAKVELPEGDYTVDVRAELGWNNTGPSSFNGTVEKVKCETVSYVQPTVTPQSCDTDLGGTKQGSLAFTLDPNLAYYLDGALVTSAMPILAAPGPHAVKVVPSVGYYLAGGVDTFTVTVPAAVGCDDLYTLPLDPFTDPETCDPFSTDGESADGSITIVHVAGVQFSIGTQSDGSDKVAAGTSATTGNVVYPKPAGDYFVFAESADPSITLKPGHDFWPLTVGVPKPACLPTQGLLVANAMATGAVCTALGASQGTIVIEPTPGVSYAFKGGAAITAASTKVAPGTYTIVATADDGLSTLSADEWVLTVAATTALCDLTTLALTGQSPIGLVALGILLLQAGLVLMGIRLVRTRLTPRHVSA